MTVPIAWAMLSGFPRFLIPYFYPLRGADEGLAALGGRDIRRLLAGRVLST